jgi:cardiolipin synthase
MKVQIILGSSDFWEALSRDIASAKSRVWIQTMSFEGDKVGKELCDALKKSKAADKRLMVDQYSRININDQFVFHPQALLNASFRKEVKDTRTLCKELPESGVQIRFTNPLGWFAYRLPARNHKKIIIIDEGITYIGGINFCEHNFGWHDMMIRLEHTEVNKALIKDFQSSWEGTHCSASEKSDNLELFFCDGTNSTALYEQLFQRLSSAKHSIAIHSPYITFPWLSHLKDLAAKGINVTLLTPEANNKPMLTHYLQHELWNSDITVRMLSEKMSHLKAILIDDTTLITGSSNFDCVSYYAEQEIIIVAEDSGLAASFKEKVWEPDWNNSKPFPLEKRTLKGFLSDKALKIASWYCQQI